MKHGPSRARRGRILVLPVLAVAWQVAASAQRPVDGVVTEERARVTLHAVRLRIDAERGADPSACAAIGPEHLAVRLRERRVPSSAVVDLERRRPPALHALLIDASNSMVGKLDFVREAATTYIEHLQPGRDRALVIAFDEDTRLVQPPTDDREALKAAVGRIRLGEATALNDGLYYAIDELAQHRERPVVVLLTDGVDTASLYERDDVHALAAGRPDLTLFAIGYALPEIGARMPGASTARRFLQTLAGDSGGAYFDVPTAGRLAGAYRRIRQMLDNEAVLIVRDPDPDAEGGTVKVRSRVPGCDVTVFRELEPEALASPPVSPAGRRELPVGAALRPRYGLPDSLEVPDRCTLAADGELPERACFFEHRAGGLSGCLLDVAMDTGVLYSNLDWQRWEVNGWIDLRIRPFELDAPAPGLLPTNPVAVLDRLAEQLRSLPAVPERTDPRKRPADDHARPFEDLPRLINGRVLLDQRARFAEGLYGDPRFERFVRERVEREAERELTALVESWLALEPGFDAVELRRIAEASPVGRRILDRAASPGPEEQARHLGAWLGDVPAYELFTRWESEAADRLLRGEGGVADFTGDWRAVRRLLFVPSYARILAPLIAGYDPVRDRIGFWRVVLPRVSWLGPRVKDLERHPDYRDMPLDLIPDVPLAFGLLRAIVESDPAASASLRASPQRVRAIRYELIGKPYRRDPPRAFRDVRVTVELGPAGAPDAAGDGLRLVAELQAPTAAGPHTVVHCEWQGAGASSSPACPASLRAAAEP